MERVQKKVIKNAAAKVTQPMQEAKQPTDSFQFKDNRPEAAAQQIMQSLADVQLKQIKPIQKKNSTGMPDHLKSGVENLSGIDMSDVKVHYNSSQPTQLNAHAYAQGTNIHIAPGQGKYLPHEAWHVVQQKQGRVKPTMQMKKGVAVNDDKGLEQEADVMGAKAVQHGYTNQEIILQRKAEPNIIQMGGAMSRLNSPAPTRVMHAGTKVYRATTQSPRDLRNAGGMTRLGNGTPVVRYRVPLYMMFSFTNPGVISTARSKQAAIDFALGLQSRNQEEGKFDPVHVYEIDASGQQAIDMEKNVPKVFKWLYKSEEEEMINETIPTNRITHLLMFGNEVEKPKDDKPTEKK